VLARFGATTAAMTRRLDRYDAIMSDAGARPTWPTTACVLDRHPALLRRYAERGVELALHGLVHGDHAALDHREQRETIVRAVDIFHRAGLHPVGFRGPYLRYNSATLDVLRELGMTYHCSQAVAFPVLDQAMPPRAAANYQLALELYSARDARRVAVIPRLRDGLVDIPVAIPDDEVLIERLGFSPEDRIATWRDLLGLTYERGELFTIQLHPERILELAEALRAVLAEAQRRRPGVFVAQLHEIASWWTRRAEARLDVSRIGGDRYRVHLAAAADVTLLVRGLDIPRSPWCGRDDRAEQRTFETGSPRAPIVGISRRSPAAIGTFLAEEGLPFEISEEREGYGAYIDVADASWSETAIVDTIARSPGPLVRIWRWPSAARSALAITGDIDALTLRDFISRSWETRRPRSGGLS